MKNIHDSQWKALKVMLAVVWWGVLLTGLSDSLSWDEAWVKNPDERNRRLARNSGRFLGFLGLSLGMFLFYVWMEKNPFVMFLPPILLLYGVFVGSNVGGILFAPKEKVSEVFLG